MTERLRSLMQWRTDLCLEGRFAELADQYLYPLTIHALGQTLVVADAARMAEMLDSWRRDWKSRGVARAVVTVTAADEMRRGRRFRIWTTVQEFGATGFLLGQKFYVQHCRQTPHGVKTEMAEIIPAEAAQIWPQQRVGKSGG